MGEGRALRFLSTLVGYSSGQMAADATCRPQSASPAHEFNSLCPWGSSPIQRQCQLFGATVAYQSVPHAQWGSSESTRQEERGELPLAFSLGWGAVHPPPPSPNSCPYPFAPDSRQDENERGQHGEEHGDDHDPGRVKGERCPGVGVEGEGAIEQGHHSAWERQEIYRHNMSSE